MEPVGRLLPQLLSDNGQVLLADPSERTRHNRHPSCSTSECMCSVTTIPYHDDCNGFTSAMLAMLLLWEAAKSLQSLYAPTLSELDHFCIAPMVALAAKDEQPVGAGSTLWT